MIELVLGALLLAAAVLLWNHLPSPVNVLLGVLFGVLGAVLLLYGLLDVLHEAEVR